MEGHGNLESYTYDVTIYLAHVLVLFCVCYSLDKQKVIDLESFTCLMELLIQTEHTASDDPHAPINWVGLGGGGRGPCPSPSTKRSIPSHIRHLFIAMTLSWATEEVYARFRQRLGGCNWPPLLHSCGPHSWLKDVKCSETTARRWNHGECVLSSWGVL